MRSLLLIALFMAPACVAQEPTVVTPKQHPCEAGVDFVRAHAVEYPSDWSIVVVCGRAEYERYEKLWQVRTNMGAFTVLNARRTFIFFDLNSAGVKRQDLTLFLLAHELRHIKCMCDLREGSG